MTYGSYPLNSPQDYLTAIRLDKINAIKEGAGMDKNAVKKGEAADYMQVSLPTLRKFLKQHQDFLDEKLVDIDKVNKWMEEESIKNLEKRGKVQ